MYVVTGANGQTGRHVVRALLAHGAHVRAVVRRPEQVSAWQAAGAETVVADLVDEDALADAFAGARGVYFMNPPAYTAPDIFSAAAAVHAAEITAAERARVEHIVALSSVAAVLGNRGQANYAAAKSGLHGAVRCLAREMASRGITANVVAPGVIAGAMTDGVFDEAQIKSLVPVARAGTPQEVAAVVAFLCSDAAAYVNGQVIGVNGGMA